MKRTLELLYEIGTLRNLKRTWCQWLGHNVQNVSEHTLRVIWLALTISRLEKKGKEYKERNSIEAKIVKDADYLDVDLELAELERVGSKFKHFHKPYREKIAK